MNISRRSCLSMMAGAAAAAPGSPSDELTVCAFSKHFQWAGIQELSDVCKSLGYGGIDLTVRRGGHIEPATVADDLPKAVETIRKTGLSVPMVTADIVDVRSPNAEPILKTLKQLGIRRYRWGGFRYTESRPIPEQLAEYGKKAAELAAMNKQYGVCAMYHTHSGPGQVGASMWDLYLILKDLDTNAVSVNYDIGHATAEGGYGGWIHSTRLLLPYMKGIAVKDFRWKQNAKGIWQPGWCPLGAGMVDFKRFLAMVKAADFRGPLQIHMEYPELGGAETGKREFTIPKDKLLAMMRGDIDRLKAMLREAGIAAA